MEDQRKKVAAEIEKLMLMQSYPNRTGKLIWLALYLLSVAVGAILLYRYLKGHGS